MRVRHRQPVLVSMWMLDVFCCALGCVTLLWLLNTRQAGDQTAAAKSALLDLASTRTDLATVRTDLDSTRLKLNADLQALSDKLAAVVSEKERVGRLLGIAEGEAKSARETLDATKVALNAAKAKLDSNAVDLAATSAKVDDAADMLRKKQAAADALTKKLAESVAASDELAKLLRKREEDRAAAAKVAADLQAKAADLDARLRAARTDAAAAVEAGKLAGTKGDKDLAAAAGLVKDLEKRIADASAQIIDLQGEKAKLADKLDKVKTDPDSKFAGIAMTGKRVVFMVDMSGSMDRTSENVIAPTKWPTVAETVAKVMRSVPELEKYQVVVFSREARWLSGVGAWQTYAGEQTAKDVKEALLKVKPEGDTNLYAAFDLAFALRPDGLDTVYLFSDGLPTSGPGLSAEQERQNPPLRESEKSEALSRHLRARLNVGWNRPAAGRPRVKINSVGFFYESPEVGAFLWSLSRENDGSFVGMSRP